MKLSLFILFFVFNLTLILDATKNLEDSKEIKTYVQKFIFYSDLLRYRDFSKNLMKKRIIENNLNIIRKNLMSFANKKAKNAYMLSSILDEVLEEKLNEKLKAKTSQKNRHILNKLNAITGFWG